MKVCCDFWSVYLILLFVIFVELLGLVYAFFLLFMDIFGCLCLADRT
jgi:hypothetical protein